MSATHLRAVKVFAEAVFSVAVLGEYAEEAGVPPTLAERADHLLELVALRNLLDLLDRLRSSH